MMLGKLRNAAGQAASKRIDKEALPQSIRIDGPALDRPHDLRTDVTRTLSFESEVCEMLPSYKGGKVLTANIVKQWENSGKSQPYSDAVKIELGTSDGGSYLLDLWYYPSGNVWRVETHRHTQDRSRFTFLIRRPDNKEENQLALEDVQFHRDIESGWKLDR